MIIGKDFGVTRKAACKEVMQWLPPKRNAQFMVTDRIAGFHPKAVFWKEATGKCFGVVGSSNLTGAAFGTNYEANVFSSLPKTDYAKAKKWFKDIEKQSVVVSEDWLQQYKEAPNVLGHGGPKTGGQNGTPVVALELPKPPGMSKQIAARRARLAAYQKVRGDLIRLFCRCASKEISSKQFYRELSKYWNKKVRLQGKGFEIAGKHSDFRTLSQSLLRILDASNDDRDDTVREEIDRLSAKRVPTRGSFLSEMLCLRFPATYPVVGEPVYDYLKAIKYRAPRRASEGARFIFLSRSLRESLLRNPNHPAKNLAELDTVIWLAYGKRSPVRQGAIQNT